MIAKRLRHIALVCAAALLSACAHLSAPVPLEQPSTLGKVDETVMLPLLGYLEQLPRLSAQELQSERGTLTATAPTPATQLRLAAVLAQSRSPGDLVRALTLLDRLLKASDPAANSLHPLARLLAAHYQERLKWQTQSDKLGQQLNDTLQRNAELQEKLDALAAIERSLPTRPIGGQNLPGSRP